MPTVADQVNSWLANIGKTFAGGFAGSGENGVDITMPYHSPVYAVTGGTVVGAGSYGGGGVVSVESSPGVVPYYQHLSDWVVSVGQTIKPGQLIGYSGGQNGYGDHPASPQYSSWPHIEFGINGPFGASSIWHPEGPNVDPLPFLQSLVGQSSGASTATLASTSRPGLPNVTNPFSGLDIAGVFGSEFTKINAGIVDWLKRGALIGLGAVLIILALVAIFLDSDTGKAAVSGATSGATRAVLA